MQIKKEFKVAKTLINKIKNDTFNYDLKSWYGYKLNITELTWSRNLIDGVNVDIYKNNNHLISFCFDYLKNEAEFTFINE